MRGGDEMAKRKRDENEPVPEEELDRIFGDGEALKKLPKKGAKGLSGLTNELVRLGNLNKLRWMHVHGCTVMSHFLCSKAAGGGYYDVLEWLHSQGCPWTKTTCSYAAGAGHLEILKFARAKGCKWDEDTAKYAITNGHLEVLKWACENGCKTGKTSLLMNTAAYHGRFEIIKYLHEIGCTWEARTCALAAEGRFENLVRGYLEILKWLRDHGCPWDSGTCESANHYKHWDCLKYAIENECPGHEEYADKLPPEYRA
jgi:hypothetical protein